MSKKFDLIVKKYQNICLYCNKPISVLCGTPIIFLGGCCFGWIDEVHKIIYTFPRKAHIHCWLKKNNLKIVKVKK